MAKQTLEKNITIFSLKESDISMVVKNFKEHHWDKPESIFKQYLEKQQSGERFVWIAYWNNQFAGYVTLKWKSKYLSFQKNSIPEIMDLNVLSPFRHQDIGSKLLETAELAASNKSGVVGIGVGLYTGADGGYGEAQKLYVRRGYVPDGRGIAYDYQPLEPGARVIVDDDLVLWFTKEISH